jgi:Tfp pilus assembly protein PilN
MGEEDYDIGYSGTDRRDTCNSHTGQDERIKSVGSKINVLIWICGVGMTLNLVVVSAVGGMMFNANSNQSRAIATLEAKQEAMKDDIRDLKISVQSRNQIDRATN